MHVVCWVKRADFWGGTWVRPEGGCLVRSSRLAQIKSPVRLMAIPRLGTSVLHSSPLCRSVPRLQYGTALRPEPPDRDLNFRIIVREFCEPREGTKSAGMSQIEVDPCRLKKD